MGTLKEWDVGRRRPAVDMDTQTYDDVRNLTILFFLDRLVDKNQARTLHDLSCQFGTKGFTKEMRQIAGGSQSGLKKFLSQYPSLFTIDGEYVSITCYTNGNSNGPSSSSGGGGSGGGGSGTTGSTSSRGRDYTVEAVDYFRDKLEQYGAAEVPIKSLLGHRSQASLEVRHISGQHIREFRDFLARFPDTFVVHDDYVVLTKHWEAIGEGGVNEGGTLERREESPTPVDPPIDAQLMAQILGFCRAAVEGNGSSATPVDHLFSQLSAKLSRNTWSGLIKNVQDLSTLLKMHSDTFTVHGGCVSLVPRRQFSSSVAGRVGPSTVTAATTTTTTTTDAASSSSSTSPCIAVAAALPTNSSSSSGAKAPMPSSLSFKQRLMSHLIKAVADNNAMEQRVYQTGSAPAAGHLGSSNASVPNFDVALTSARLLKSVKVVVKIQECQAIVARIKAHRPLVVSFDAEGVNLGPSGPMTLLQLGTGDGQIYLFDLVACRELITDGGLREILESTDVVKVVHDCRNDSAALYHQFGVSMQNVFDTQAAHAVIQLQQTGKPVHKVKNVSLNTVCRMYGGPINPKKEQMKKLYRRDQKFWSRRPLTDDMILYAAYDIWALVPTVYEAMRAQMLEDDANQLFRQLCAEQADAYVRVDQVKHSKKLRKIEAEVIELKRKMAATAGNKTVVLSNREIRLLRHVDLTDEERDKLEGSHKVARKLERLQGRGSANAGGGGIGGGGVGDQSAADSSEASPEMDDDFDEEDDDEEDDDFEVENEDIENGEEGDGEDGDGTSPFYPFGANRGRSTSPTLEDSILLVEQFLAKERFEALGLDNDENGSVCASCVCNCHSLQRVVSDATVQHEHHRAAAAVSGRARVNAPVKVDSGSQTLSTGDIVITKVYFEDKANSPKGGGVGGVKTAKDANATH